jgi:hypothetical protein
MTTFLAFSESGTFMTILNAIHDPVLDNFVLAAALSTSAAQLVLQAAWRTLVLRGISFGMVRVIQVLAIIVAFAMMFVASFAALKVVIFMVEAAFGVFAMLAMSPIDHSSLTLVSPLKAFLSFMICVTTGLVMHKLHPIGTPSTPKRREGRE